jgi:hypothetical protein
MNNFYKWCEEKGYKLPTINEQPPAADSTDEGSAKRACVRSHAYPPAYGRGQYTKNYFTPTAADTLVYDKDNH